MSDEEVLKPDDTFEEAAKTLVEKLDSLLDRDPIFTGYGYLHIIRENELEPEFSELKAYTHPQPEVVEPPPEEVPQNV